MKKILLIMLLLTTTILAKSQTNDTTKTTSGDTAKIFYRVEVSPSYPGGIERMFNYIAKNENADGNEGSVRVSFVIEKDGSITNIKIDQSLKDDADKEAIRLVSQMPKWNPGMQGGRPVRVRYSMPIHFPAQ